MRSARVLARGRRDAEERMTEQVTAGEFVDGVDPVTGDPTRVIETQRYSGIARIRYTSLAASSNMQGSDGIGQAVIVQTPFLSIPHGSPRLYESDEVRIVSSESDGILVGRTYRIAGNAIAGQSTSHRYPLTELS